MAFCNNDYQASGATFINPYQGLKLSLSAQLVSISKLRVQLLLIPIRD